MPSTEDCLLEKNKVSRDLSGTNTGDQDLSNFANTTDFKSG
jgi:hypothetical protein